MTEPSELSREGLSEGLLELLSEFKKLCKIPRPSHFHEKIHTFLQECIGKSLTETLIETDKAGNMAILMNPPHDEKRASLILQSHMDMVSLADPQIVHDWKNDPILCEEVKVDNNIWLRARGTTLGADNGMGMMASIVVARHVVAVHSKNLYLLITADEEHGLEGAKHLNLKILPKKARVINLDSESSHAICVGSAGTSKAKVVFQKVSEMSEISEMSQISKTKKTMSMQILGGQGGHSGVEIHRGRANVIKLCQEALAFLKIQEILSIDGGDAENAIPSHCKATFVGELKDTSVLNPLIARWKETYNEPDLKIVFQEEKASQSSLMPQACVDFIQMVHHGVLGLNPYAPEQLKTSSNLGLIETKGEIVTLTLMSRSLCVDALQQYHENLQLLTKYTKGQWEDCGLSPSWFCGSKSEALHWLQASHKLLFGKEAKTFSIHAGLETAVLQQTFPEWDIVSIGPEIENAHTTREQVSVESVEDFVKWLSFLVEN